MTKTHLRTLYKQQRLALSASQKMKLDDLLLIQLQRLSLPGNLQTLMTFWPIEKQAEVNTHLFIRYLQYAVPDLQVAYPVIVPETQQMQAFAVDDDTEFVENIYCVPEPTRQKAMLISPLEIDMVFVPLLAFDKQGYRVGYGKGYYDRYLQQCNAEVFKVGFSYFEAVDEITDASEHDIPLSYCITPERIYEF